MEPVFAVHSPYRLLGNGASDVGRILAVRVDSNCIDDFMNVRLLGVSGIGGGTAPFGLRLVNKDGASKEDEDDASNGYEGPAESDGAPEEEPYYNTATAVPVLVIERSAAAGSTRAPPAVITHAYALAPVVVAYLRSTKNSILQEDGSILQLVLLLNNSNGSNLSGIISNSYVASHSLISQDRSDQRPRDTTNSEIMSTATNTKAIDINSSVLAQSLLTPGALSLVSLRAGYYKQQALMEELLMLRRLVLYGAAGLQGNASPNNNATATGVTPAMKLTPEVALQHYNAGMEQAAAEVIQPLRRAHTLLQDKHWYLIQALSTAAAREEAAGVTETGALGLIQQSASDQRQRKSKEGDEAIQPAEPLITADMIIRDYVSTFAFDDENDAGDGEEDAGETEEEVNATDKDCSDHQITNTFFCIKRRHGGGVKVPHSDKAIGHHSPIFWEQETAAAVNARTKYNPYRRYHGRYLGEEDWKNVSRPKGSTAGEGGADNEGEANANNTDVSVASGTATGYHRGNAGTSKKGRTRYRLDVIQQDRLVRRLHDEDVDARARRLRELAFEIELEEARRHGLCPANYSPDKKELLNSYFSSSNGHNSRSNSPTRLGNISAAGGDAGATHNPLLPPERPTLSLSEQQALGERLHDACAAKKAETMAKLKEMYDPDPVPRKMTPSAIAASNERIYAEPMRKKAANIAALVSKYASDPITRRLTHEEQEKMADRLSTK